ncbi:hypothetical protein HY971_05080 [Candidatus Kaiserbacteria bacterium]|nr:hypothetical protein [Candidatus Kaiserbacteria bacterium]
MTMPAKVELTISASPEQLAEAIDKLTEAEKTTLFRVLIERFPFHLSDFE